MPRRVIDRDPQSGEVEHPFGQRHDGGGLDRCHRPERGRQIGPEPRERVRQQVSVIGVDVHGDVVCVGHCGRRGDMVDMPVGGQHGDRRQPMFPQRLLDTGFGPLTGVDDHALGPDTGGEQIAVRLQRAGREPDDEHDDTSGSGVGLTLAAPTQRPHRQCP